MKRGGERRPLRTHLPRMTQPKPHRSICPWTTWWSIWLIRGGERVAQVGITLEVRDAHAVDTVKAYLPTIRSGVLMLLSQRTADDLLSADGKQKLIDDILIETSRPFGGGDPEPEPAPGKKARKKAVVEYPVVSVLFSSLIVQ
jgi:flagellar FliL protein